MRKPADVLTAEEIAQLRKDAERRIEEQQAVSKARKEHMLKVRQPLLRRQAPWSVTAAVPKTHEEHMLEVWQLSQGWSPPWTEPYLSAILSWFFGQLCWPDQTLCQPQIMVPICKEGVQTDAPNLPGNVLATAKPDKPSGNCRWRTICK